jgi:hypothetical protein
MLDDCATVKTEDDREGHRDLLLRGSDAHQFAGVDTSQGSTDDDLVFFSEDIFGENFKLWESGFDDSDVVSQPLISDQLVHETWRLRASAERIQVALDESLVQDESRCAFHSHRDALRQKSPIQ